MPYPGHFSVEINKSIFPMIKRASKWTFIIYIFGFLISVAHFPQGVWRIARDGDARVLLAPLAMPSVLRVYGQFICAAVWPYGDDVQTVTLEELIRVHGVKPFERNPNINVVTVTVDNGLDARPVSYFLSNEFGHLEKPVAPEGLK